MPLRPPRGRGRMVVSPPTWDSKSRVQRKLSSALARSSPSAMWTSATAARSEAPLGSSYQSRSVSRLSVFGNPFRPTIREEWWVSFFIFCCMSSLSREHHENNQKRERETIPNKWPKSVTVEITNHEVNGGKSGEEGHERAKKNSAP